MRHIYHIIEPFDRLLGKQKVKVNQTYRLMNFVIKQLVDDGTLLFNTMTKAMVLLSTEEMAQVDHNPSAFSSLIEDWFLVPVDYDDRLLSRQMRRVGLMLAKPKKDITVYTIFTTTDCNARCFYCFQKENSRKTMDVETARRTADFIIRHCHGQSVLIRWFGGEPLFNKSVILLISRLLKDAGVEFKCNMVSNGFLLDDATIQEAKDLWNLKRVQITLDGTEKMYNRIKSYIYKDVNAYQQVIGNIHRLLDAGIRVDIRLNIDMYNADNLALLVEELNQEFEGAEKLIVYLHTLFGEFVKHNAMYDEEKRQMLFVKIRDIRQKLRTYGLSPKSGLNRKQTLINCIADNDEAVTILPDGHLGKCDTYIDGEFVGHLEKEGFDKEMVDSFKEYCEETEACASCQLYPDCLRPRKCDSMQTCYPEEVGERISKIQRAMKASYEKKINKVEDDKLQDRNRTPC